MRLRFPTLACLALLLVVSSAVRADNPSTHGMVLFGTERTYLSHLPLFKTPNDYQVILAVRFGLLPNGKDAQAVYLKDKGEYGADFYTFEPETFVLADQIAAKKAFKGTLYRGHFARGGTPIAKDVPVNIETILHFRKLDPKAPAARDQWLLFGTKREAYFAHRISTPPDFDQIVRVSPTTPESEAAVPQSEAKVITLRVTRPLMRKTTHVAENPQGLGFVVVANVYTEHRDLEK